MSVILSSKYQVVIPKAIRKQLAIQPGQTFDVQYLKDGSILFKLFKKNPTAEVADAEFDRLIQRYAGVARGAWGPDPVATLRRMRDEEWD
jgi:AbrB family looped-hinge helix DNA binding protein